jgi:hypothetical protein
VSYYRDRFNAIEGGLVRLYMRFMSSGVLVDPTSLGRVVITPDSDQSVNLATFNGPVRQSVGTYYVEWRVPTSDNNSPYYDAIFANYATTGQRNFRDVWYDVSIGGTSFIKYGNFYVALDQAETNFDASNLLAFNYSVLTPSIPKGSRDYLVIEATEKNGRFTGTSVSYPPGFITVQKDEGRIRQYEPALNSTTNGKYALLIDSEGMKQGRYSAKLKIDSPSQDVPRKAGLTASRGIPNGYVPPAGQEQLLALAIDGNRQDFYFNSNASLAYVNAAGSEWGFPAKIESSGPVSSTQRINGATATFEIDNQTLSVKFGTYRNVSGAALVGANVVLTFSSVRPSNLSVGDTIFQTATGYAGPPSANILSLGPTDYDVTLNVGALGLWAPVPYEVGFGLSLRPSDIADQINTASVAQLGYSVVEIFTDSFGTKLRLISKTRNVNYDPLATVGSRVNLLTVTPAAMSADFQNDTGWITAVSPGTLGTDFLATVTQNEANDVLKIAVDPTGGGSSFQNISFQTGYWTSQQIVDYINAQGLFVKALILSGNSAPTAATPSFMLFGKQFSITANAITGGGVVTYNHTFGTIHTDPFSINDIIAELNAAYAANNVNVVASAIPVGPLPSPPYRLRLISQTTGSASSIVVNSDSGTGANTIIGFATGEGSQGSDPLIGAHAVLLPDNRIQIIGDFPGVLSSLQLESENNGSTGDSNLGFSASGAFALGTDNAGAIVYGDNGVAEPFAITLSTKASLQSRPVPVSGLNLDGKYLDLQIDSNRFTVNFLNTRIAASLTASGMINAVNFRQGYRFFLTPLAAPPIVHSPDKKYIGSLAGGGKIVDGESGYGYCDIINNTRHYDWRGAGFVPTRSLMQGNAGFFKQANVPLNAIGAAPFTLTQAAAPAATATINAMSYITSNSISALDANEAALHFTTGGVDRGLFRFSVDFSIGVTKSFRAGVLSYLGTGPIALHVGGIFLETFGAFHTAVRLTTFNAAVGTAPYPQAVTRNSIAIGGINQAGITTSSGEVWYIIDLTSISEKISVGDVLSIAIPAPTSFTVAAVIPRADASMRCATLEQVDNRLSYRLNNVPASPVVRTLSFDTSATQSASAIISSINSTFWSIGDQGRADRSANKLVIESTVAGSTSRVDLIHPIFDSGAIYALGYQPDNVRMEIDSAAVGKHQLIHFQFSAAGLSRFGEFVAVAADTENTLPVVATVTNGALTGYLKGVYAFYSKDGEGPFGYQGVAHEAHAYLLIECSNIADDWSLVPALTFNSVIYGARTFTAGVDYAGFEVKDQSTNTPNASDYVYELWAKDNLAAEVHRGFSGFVKLADNLSVPKYFKVAPINGARPMKGAQSTVYIKFPDFSTLNIAGAEWFIVNNVLESALTSVGMEMPLTAGEIVNQINAAAHTNGISTSPAQVAAGNRILLSSSDYGSLSNVLIWCNKIPGGVPEDTNDADNSHNAFGFYNYLSQVVVPIDPANYMSGTVSAFAAAVALTDSIPNSTTNILQVRPAVNPALTPETWAVIDVDASTNAPIYAGVWEGTPSRVILAKANVGGFVQIETALAYPTWLNINDHIWINSTVFGLVKAIDVVAPFTQVTLKTPWADEALWPVGATVYFSGGWPMMNNMYAAPVGANFLQSCRWGYGSVGTDGNDMWRVVLNGTNYSTRVASVNQYTNLASAINSGLNLLACTASSGDLILKTEAKGAGNQLRVKGLLEGGTGAESFGFGSTVIKVTTPINMVTPFTPGEILINLDNPSWTATVVETVNFQTLIVANPTGVPAVGDHLFGLHSSVQTTFGSMTSASNWRYASLANNGAVDALSTFNTGYNTLAIVCSDNKERTIVLNDIPNTPASYDRTQLLTFLNMPRVGVTGNAVAWIGAGDLIVSEYAPALPRYFRGASFVENHEGNNASSVSTIRLSNLSCGLFEVDTAAIPAPVYTDLIPGARVQFMIGLTTYDAICVTNQNNNVINAPAPHGPKWVIGLIADPSTPTTLPTVGTDVVSFNNPLTGFFKVLSQVTTSLNFKTGHPVRLFRYDSITTDYLESLIPTWNHLNHLIDFTPALNFSYSPTWNLIISDRYVAGSYDPVTYPRLGSIAVRDTSISSAWQQLHLDVLSGSQGLYNRVGGSWIDPAFVYPANCNPNAHGSDQGPPVITADFPLAANTWIISNPNAQLDARLDTDTAFHHAVLNPGSSPILITLWDIIDQINGFGIVLGLNATYPFTVQAGHTRLKFTVDYAMVPVTVNFVIGSTYTAQEIVDEINSAIAASASAGQAAATVWNGQVMILSLHPGLSSEILIHEDDGTLPGYINGWLGFPWQGAHSYARSDVAYFDDGGTAGFLGTGIRALATVEDFLSDGGHIRITTAKYPQTNILSSVEIGSSFYGSSANSLLGFAYGGVGPVYGNESDFTYTINDIVNRINAAYGGYAVAAVSGNSIRLESIVQGNEATVEILPETTWHVQRTIGLTPQLVYGDTLRFIAQTITSPWIYFDIS